MIYCRLPYWLCLLEVVNIVNYDHMTVEDYNCCKCKPIAKYFNHNHMTNATLRTSCLLFQHCWNFKESLNNWLISKDFHYYSLYIGHISLNLLLFFLITSVKQTDYKLTLEWKNDSVPPTMILFIFCNFFMLLNKNS